MIDSPSFAEASTRRLADAVLDAQAHYPEIRGYRLWLARTPDGSPYLHVRVEVALGDWLGMATTRFSTVPAVVPRHCKTWVRGLIGDAVQAIRKAHAEEVTRRAAGPT